MDIVLFATKSCPHRPLMEGWLRGLDVAYRVAYAEEEPEETARLGIQHSPCLVIDGELVFQGMPSSAEFESRLRRELARRHVEPDQG